MTPLSLGVGDRARGLLLSECPGPVRSLFLGLWPGRGHPAGPRALLGPCCHRVYDRAGGTLLS